MVWAKVVAYTFMRIEWSRNALNDLGDIYDYIARDVSVSADRFVDKIITATLKLKDQS